VLEKVTVFSLQGLVLLAVLASVTYLPEAIILHIFLALVGLMLVLYSLHRKTQKRTQLAKVVAAEMGFEHLADPMSAVPDVIWQMNNFKMGSHRRFPDLLRGQVGDVTIFVGSYRFNRRGRSGSRYASYPGNGRVMRSDSSRFGPQNVVILQSPHLNLPAFSLAPEHGKMMIKMAEMLGLKDIDFESYPQFSKRFLLRASDEAAVRHRFHHGVLTFFEQHQGIAAEGVGAIWVYYPCPKSERAKMHPDQWKGLVGEALGLHGQLARQGLYR